MEFLDLSDEIGADEWLIESDRIAERRLVKRTPRFNIYKADYFGDSNVLVYEPVVSDNQQATSKRLHNKQQEYLRDRLSRLDLNLDGTFSLGARAAASPPLSPCISSCASSEGEQTIDSAYSSISSTPQYHTKTEFQYPTIGTTHTSKSETVAEEEIRVEVTSSTEQSFVKRPVVLNRDSFGRQQAATGATGGKQSFWPELNELRLVAHENFMLFMGASLAQDQQLAAAQCLPTLVMEMNHPKAVSFYNLLHNWKWTAMGDRCSPIQLKRPQLSYRAKSNICQQVTNAMAYLHARNIVHGKLTSVNIYMDLNQRIKISLLDDDERALATSASSDCDKNPMTTGNRQQHFVDFNLPSLTYLSPELIRTISLGNGANGATKESKCHCDNQAPVQIDTNQLTKESDIFSFGTFLFELFEEKYPFAANTDGCSRPFGQSSWNGNIKQSANELIYQIGSGQIASKNLSSQQNHKSRVDWCPQRSLVASIIAQCWSEDPSFRPQFKQLAAMFCD